MQGRLLNFSEVLEKLRPFLHSYLHELGVDPTKNFMCFNPKHVDSAPSMTCKNITQTAYCFGCKATYDVFDIYAIVNKKPMSGPGWLETVIFPLAEKYDVELKFRELSEEEQLELDTYRAYKAAADLIADPSFGDYTKFNTELEKRGWDIEICKELGIGTVEYKPLIAKLKEKGFSAKFLDDIDLHTDNAVNIFTPDCMIFTISDDKGNPVGFSARKIGWRDKHDGPKYCNTSGKCPIFKKSEKLYLLDKARNYTPPLYIVEGYPDAVTAYHKGLRNIVALAGTSFSSQHLESLVKHNMFDVVFCFDTDANDAGHKSLEAILEKKVTPDKPIRAKVIVIPGGQDPDDYIRENGINAFTSLKVWTAFEWMLGRYMTRLTDTDEIIEKMVPFIISEGSPIARNKMIKKLAEFTSYDFGLINGEVEYKLDQVQGGVADKKRNIIEQAAKRSRYQLEDASTILSQAITSINTLDSKAKTSNLSEEKFIHQLINIKKDEEERSDEIGFKFDKDGLGFIGEQCLAGNWAKKLILVGGAANSGKSAICCQIGYEIASNPENNALVIYHTIDDPMEDMIPRFVIHAYGLPDIEINHIVYPSAFEARGIINIKRKREIGYNKLLELVKERRLIVKSAEDGVTLSFGEQLIKHFKAKFPDRKIIYIIDNLHKAADLSASLTGAEKARALSDLAKRIAVINDATVIATVEYTKMEAGVRPNNQNIADSRGFVYDCNAILHLYNDLHERGDMAKVFFMHEGIKHPRIEVIFGKNKISSYKGKAYLDFYAGSSILKNVPLEVAEEHLRIAEMIKESEKEILDKNHAVYKKKSEW